MRSLLAGVTVALIGASTAGAVLPDPPGTLRSSVQAVRQGQCAAEVEPLRRLSRERGPTGGRAAFLLGHCLTVLRRHDESRDAFLAASRQHETLTLQARVRAARAALRGGHAAEAVTRTVLPQTASAAAVSTAVRRDAQLVLAEGLRLSGRPREAVAAARALLRGKPPDPVLAEGWWFLGQAAEVSGNAGLARHAYGMAWWAVPGGPRAADGAAALRRLSRGRNPVPPAEARAERGLRLVAAGEAKAAEHELAFAVRGSLVPDLAAEAWYQLGLLRLGKREAVTAFREAARFRVERDRVLFWWGQALLRVGRSSEGRAVWDRLRREYPESLWSARAVAARGRIAEVQGRLDDADRWYDLLVRQFPQSPRADDGRWRRAWMRYRTGKYGEAGVLFERYGRSFPETPRAAAHLYWAARTRARLGGAGAPLLRIVAEQYPLTFYGQRARLRLGLPDPALPPAPAPRVLAAERFSPAYEELAALGLDADATAEVEALIGDEPPPALRRAAAELYARQGDVTASITAALPLIERALFAGERADVGLWRLAYPRAFWDTVSAEAARHRLDPLLILALIREESRFDPRVVSPAGAVGLMQLLPSTARGILGARAGSAQLMDPAVSIRAGTAYLAGLLRRFRGTLPAALAAYNAGPGGVRRFADLARADLDRFVEGLPQAETRAYVQRVLQTYGIYRWLYQ